MQATSLLGPEGLSLLQTIPSFSGVRLSGLSDGFVLMPTWEAGVRMDLRSTWGFEQGGLLLQQ